MDRTTKRALWIVAGVVVFLALLLHHNITSDEVIFFVIVVPSVILHEIFHGGWPGSSATTRRSGPAALLNPLVHVDPIGTLLFLAAMAFLGFSWGGPSPCR